jgi:hypothetical protein
MLLPRMLPRMLLPRFAVSFAPLRESFTVGVGQAAVANFT